MFIVEHYFYSSFYATVKIWFQQEFPYVTIPIHSTIKRIIDKFCTPYPMPTTIKPRDIMILQCSTNYQEWDCHRCPEQKKNDNCVNELSRNLECQHSVLANRMATLAELFALWGEGMHPYHISTLQELQTPDFEKCCNFCTWLKDQFGNNIEEQPIIFFTDEACFTCLTRLIVRTI